MIAEVLLAQLATAQLEGRNSWLMNVDVGIVVLPPEHRIVRHG